jgi:hypothetical protein
MPVVATPGRRTGCSRDCGIGDRVSRDRSSTWSVIGRILAHATAEDNKWLYRLTRYFLLSAFPAPRVIRFLIR